MYECIRHGVEFLLAGSIRDDGPLPEVITDVLEAQQQMRERLRGVTFCLMIATTLHSIAVGNLLPAWVKVVCVDINPSTAIKLADRGSFQTVGLVTDVAPFLRALVEELAAMKGWRGGADCQPKRQVAKPDQAELPMQALTACPHPRCARPIIYGIEYEINPWMDRQRQADHDGRCAVAGSAADCSSRPGRRSRACRRWPGLPDLVFTANAAIDLSRQAILARFRHPQRQGEEPHDQQWLAAHGFRVRQLPADVFFEGAGDALFCGDTLFAGYRIRSDIARAPGNRRPAGLPRDSAGTGRSVILSPRHVLLPAGRRAWRSIIPPAFDDYGRRALRGAIDDLIAVDDAEARQFACNAVVVGRTVITNTGCPELHRQLRLRGFEPRETPLGEFVKAGGSAKCLTLRLDGEDAAAWRQGDDGARETTISRGSGPPMTD